MISPWSVRAQTQKQPVIIPGQYIVVLKESFAVPVVRSGLNTSRSANTPNKELRQQVLNKIKDVRSRQRIDTSAILFYFSDAIAGFSAKLSDAEVSALRNDHSVQGVYQDIKIQLAYTSRSENMAAPASQVEDCAIVTSGGHTDGSSKFTWIWIIDTGIDTDHADLNVQTKAPYAKTFIGNSFEDLNGHGTHVAGIAAAKDNGIGVVGMSAGAKVVPVKIIDDAGNTGASLVIAALDHVAQYSIPGDVVNMSLGGFTPDCGVLSFPAMITAMENLGNEGVWICSAAGNDNNNATFYLPGCIDNTRVFTVAALDCNNACAAYTNLGSNIDWYAVGTNVYSTYKDGGYATLSGTSMACPVVAGIVHSRGQAPVRGPNITCPDVFGSNVIKPLARRQ